MADCAALELLCAGNGTGGSNPPLSALLIGSHRKPMAPFFFALTLVTAAASHPRFAGSPASFAMGTCARASSGFVCSAVFEDYCSALVIAGSPTKVKEHQRNNEPCPASHCFLESFSTMGKSTL